MGVNPFAWLASLDYVPAVNRMFPRGASWSAEPGSTFANIKAAVADVAGNVHAIGATLVELEAHPLTTTVLLPDWEADYGLPDPCTPLAPTLQQRRLALAAKIAASGGASLSYLVSVAAALGFTITARNGISADGAGWQYLIVITAAAGQSQFFRAGTSGAGDFLQTFGNMQLECVLNKIKPAHLTLQFNYI